MVDMFYAKELEDVKLENKPDTMEDKVWKKQDRRALGNIRNTLSMDVVSHFANETHPLDSWRDYITIWKPLSFNKIHISRRSM